MYKKVTMKPLLYPSRWRYVNLLDEHGHVDMTLCMEKPLVGVPLWISSVPIGARRRYGVSHADE